DSFERRGESPIGCDTACDHESAPHLSAESFDVNLHGARGPVSHDVGDSFLEARAEIRDVLLAQRRASERLEPERGLESCDREMRFAAAEHGAGQRDGGAATRSACLDCGAAGIAYAEQRARLINGFA